MEIIISFFVYSFTTVFSAFTLYNASKLNNLKERNFVALLAIVFPVLIAGLRFSIGTDYFTYILGFERIRAGQVVRWSVEYGYVFFNRVLGKLGLGSQSIMFGSSLIMMIFVIKSLVRKNQVDNIAFGLITFMLIFYQSSYNVIRLMIATSMFLFNIHNIINRNCLRYLVITIVAASFHVTAFITIPLYWIFNHKRTVIIKTLIYIGAIIIFFNPILEQILSITHLTYYEKYIGRSNESIMDVLKQVLIYLPLMLPGAFFYKKCEEVDKNFYIYYSFVVIGITLTSFSSFLIEYVSRLAQYFLIASVMLIPIYITTFNKYNYRILNLCILSYLIFYWLLTYFIFGNHGTVPYQWILS